MNPENSRHTPGPWTEHAPEVDGVVQENYRTVQAGNFPHCYDSSADTWGYSGFALTGFISAANARLIAAAPAMYEALRKVLDAHNTDAPGWPSKTVGGDDVVYHLDGQRMYIAINAARDALSLVSPAPSHLGDQK